MSLHSFYFKIIDKSILSIYPYKKYKYKYNHLIINSLNNLQINESILLIISFKFFT